MNVRTQRVLTDIVRREGVAQTLYVIGCYLEAAADTMNDIIADKTMRERLVRYHNDMAEKLIDISDNMTEITIL